MNAGVALCRGYRPFTAHFIGAVGQVAVRCGQTRRVAPFGCGERRLIVVTRRGTADAAEFVFRVFRRQQQERFLPGLKKLGLDGLPPAVAAAQYHYLSNWIGGVHVQYVYENDRKAWIRYPPPRWIWKGTAICGVPGEVSRAMLRGWQGWLSLKEHELDRGPASGRHEPELDTGSALGAARIELSDLKERIRKLEAIASGVDL